MEPTPRAKTKITDYIRGQLDGTGPAPSGPTRPGQKLRDHIQARLSGEPAPSATDQPDAPTGVNPETWSKAQAAAKDPQDPAYDIASALLTVAQALADVRKGTQP
jgi:hypothetical protein